MAWQILSAKKGRPRLQNIVSDHKCINGLPPASQTDEGRAKSIYSSYHGIAKTDESFVGLWRTWECTSDLCAENHYSTLGTPQGAASKCFSVIHPVFGHDWSEPMTYHYPLIDSDGWHYSADPDLKGGAHGSAVRAQLPWNVHARPALLRRHPLLILIFALLPFCAWCSGRSRRRSSNGFSQSNTRRTRRLAGLRTRQYG